MTCTCGTQVQLSQSRAHGVTCTHVAIACAAVAAHGVTRCPDDGAQQAAAAAAPTFSCPLCPPPLAAQLEAGALVAHVLATHAGVDSSPAVCPLCAAAPWGDPSRVSRNWAAHVALRHVSADGGPGGGPSDSAAGALIAAAEEAVLQSVLARSLAEAGIGPGGADAEARLAEALAGIDGGDYDSDGEDG